MQNKENSSHLCDIHSCTVCKSLQTQIPAAEITVHKQLTTKCLNNNKKSETLKLCVQYIRPAVISHNKLDSL